MHQIDWGQVLTQIIGFLVVLGILKKFAWGPILDLLEARREKIRREFADIDAEKARALELKAKLDAELKAIEAQARVKIQEGVQEGERVGGEIKEKARQDAHALLQRAEEQVERERDKAQVQLRDDMTSMVLAATERILHEKLDPLQHKKQIEGFLDSLGSATRRTGA